MILRKKILAFALALLPAMAMIAPATASANVAGQLMGDLQRDLGLTNAQAAGIVGNLAHETGNFQFMQEISPLGGRGGYGFAQWTAERRVEFEDYAASNGYDINSYEANYGYLIAEIQSGRHGSIANVLSATTPEEAAYWFMKDYLRPHEDYQHLDARVNFANQFADGSFEGSPTIAGGGTFTPTEPPETKLMIWLASDARGAMPPGAY